MIAHVSLLVSLRREILVLQKIANMESTYKDAQRESNVASQVQYIPGNYTITCFMVATHAALLTFFPT